MRTHGPITDTTIATRKDMAANARAKHADLGSALGKLHALASAPDGAWAEAVSVADGLADELAAILVPALPEVAEEVAPEPDEASVAIAAAEPISTPKPSRRAR